MSRGRPPPSRRRDARLTRISPSLCPRLLQGLRTAGREVRRPDCTLVTVDHNVPTSDRSSFDTVENFIKETDSACR